MEITMFVPFGCFFPLDVCCRVRSWKWTTSAGRIYIEKGAVLLKIVRPCCRFTCGRRRYAAHYYLIYRVSVLFGETLVVVLRQISFFCFSCFLFFWPVVLDPTFSGYKSVVVMIVILCFSRKLQKTNKGMLCFISCLCVCVCLFSWILLVSGRLRFLVHSGVTGSFVISWVVSFHKTGWNERSRFFFFAILSFHACLVILSLFFIKSLIIASLENSQWFNGLVTFVFQFFTGRDQINLDRKNVRVFASFFVAQRALEPHITSVVGSSAVAGFFYYLFSSCSCRFLSFVLFCFFCFSHCFWC